MVVGSIELLIELDHQAFEEGGELLLLLARLGIQKERVRTFLSIYVFLLCCVSLCSCIV